MTKIKEVLEEIAEGKGAYSRDVLTHATNTIRDMKELAKKAVGLLNVHELHLQELAELLKNQPLPISREYAVEPHEHLKIVSRNLQNLNDYFNLVTKKLEELTK